MWSPCVGRQQEPDGSRWVAIPSDTCQSTPKKMQNTHVWVKMGFYIAQYPIFTSIYHWDTCSLKRHLDLSGKHSAILQLTYKDYSYTSIYHCLRAGIIKRAGWNEARFYRATQGSNPGPLRRRSDAPLHHCTTAPLLYYVYFISLV